MEEEKQDTIVSVASEKDPTILYSVNMTTGECSCPNYQHRIKAINESDGGHRTCKHYQMVRRLQSDEG